MKREVDFVLDQCSDTMTPMHYHLREVILVTYNKVSVGHSTTDRNLYGCSGCVNGECWVKCYTIDVNLLSTLSVPVSNLLINISKHLHINI